MKRKLILVFKTHFDIGFTDLSRNVIRSIGARMCPQVLETCGQTASMGKLRYRWTMPAWPMRVMEEQAGECADRLRACVDSGQLVWHALPFTSHTDFCGLEDMIQGMQIAKELAERHGKPRPIAAKMTDVPGHGRMLPALLAGAGVRFLHLGCNEYPWTPDVPPLFFWEAPDGSRVLTMFSGSYGSGLTPPPDWPFPVWLALQQTNDNSGPQSAELVRRLAAQAQELCPDAEVVSGTLDDFYRELSACDLSGVPVVRSDLADTWIHGIGSYTNEVAAVREARRRLAKAGLLHALTGLGGAKYREARRSAYENLMLFGEHTWGLDVKTWLGPGRVYEKEAFLRERGTPRYRRMEESWAEWSERAGTAEEQSKTALRLAEEGGGWGVLSPCTEPFTGWVPVPEDAPAFSCGGLPCPEGELWGGRAVFVRGAAPLAVTRLEAAGERKAPSALRLVRRGPLLSVESSRYRVDFSPETGRVESLRDLETNRELLCARGETGVFSYRYSVYGKERMERYLHDYRRDSYVPAPERDWGELDNGREDYPDCADETFLPSFSGWETEGRSLVLRYAGTACERFGDAREIILRVTLPDAGDEIFVTLSLRGKQATPYIEGGAFSLPLAMEEPVYALNKNGNLIDPARDIADCANHVFYCLEDFASASADGLTVTAAALDTPLLSIGETGVYTYRKRYEKKDPVLVFNLFNNMWGTNFPQWTEGDCVFRFILFASRRDDAPSGRAFALAAGPQAVRSAPARLPFALPEGTRLLCADHLPASALLLRFADTGGRPRGAAVRALEPGWELCEADLCSEPISGWEADELPVQLTPWAIRTVLCRKIP